MIKPGKFFIGTSGLVLPVPNKSHYPVHFRDKSRLAYYASLYDSIEINSSFYKVPQRKTIEKWSAMVPDSFRFSFKLHRDITHKKGLDYPAAAIPAFLEAIEGAGEKKGCLLIQLPGGTKIEQYPRLESLLTDLSAQPLAKDWKLAVELRDRSWFIPETWELLNEFRAALVYQDIPKSLTPRVALKSKSIYLRYHGPTGNYRGSYDQVRLEADAAAIRTWLKKGKTVFAYFNNTLGDATGNLQTLQQLVEDSPDR